MIATAPMDTLGWTLLHSVWQLTLLPMQQSSACEVAVFDQEGNPVPGATVAFSPRHVWFNGGSQRLGYGRDTLTYLRMKRNAGQGHADPGEESSLPRGDDFYTGTEQQAQEIEGRLEKLREKYQERKKAKDQIIDLQLKVLEQEADGLGFPGVGSADGRAPRAQNLPEIADPHDATSPEAPAYDE